MTQDIRRSFIAITAICIAGLLSTGFAVSVAYKAMSAHLFTHATQAAETIGNVNFLTGNIADTQNEKYIALKEKLLIIKEEVSYCNVVYIMGQKDDGTVFFYIDSENEGSEYYSAPGEVYAEVNKLTKEIFRTKHTEIIGPYIDQWGIWMTVLIPLSFNRVIVLCMDVSAIEFIIVMILSALPTTIITLSLLLPANCILNIRKNRSDLG